MDLTDPDPFWEKPLSNRKMVDVGVRSNFGRSVDWSQGVMGLPFLAGHSVGTANGDHSETLFAG